MGRTLKRVPLDFDWPQDKVWEGYINPHYKKCPKCDGSGSTPALKRLNAIACLIALSGDEAQGRRRHPYTQGGAFDNYGEGLELSPGSIFADFVNGILSSEPKSSPFGIDVHSVSFALKEKAGLPDDWGWCPNCNGDGVHPDHKEAYEAWEPTDPPQGEGYQLWETTSEGSPVSPVFPTLRALCEHAAVHCTTFGTTCKATADEWEKMLDEGLVYHQEGNRIFL